MYTCIYMCDVRFRLKQRPFHSNTPFVSPAPSSESKVDRSVETDLQGEDPKVVHLAHEFKGEELKHPERETGLQGADPKVDRPAHECKKRADAVGELEVVGFARCVRQERCAPRGPALRPALARTSASAWCFSDRGAKLACDIQPVQHLAGRRQSFSASSLQSAPDKNRLPRRCSGLQQCEEEETSVLALASRQLLPAAVAPAPALFAVPARHQFQFRDPVTAALAPPSSPLTF